MKRGGRGIFSSFLILAVSVFWSSLSAIVRAGARAGFLRSEKLPVRVISVGNLQVGGAGKTPLVALLAREAADRGLNVCILCRGYGAEWETRGGVISPMSDHEVNPERAGDEAALLRQLAPRAWIGVGANRASQFRRISAQIPKPIDLVLLDDGFQHWKIKHDLEVLALTSAKRTQVLFRDFASAAKKADLLVWTKGEEEPSHFDRPMIRIRYSLPKAGAKNGIWLVTGVADGEFVRESAAAAGYEIRRHFSFPDHARYSEPMVLQMIVDSKKAGCQIATTGKDWVKWKGMRISDEVLVLEPEIRFEKGRDLWDRLIWGQT